MAQRIGRAKQRIRDAGARFVLPPPDERAGRLGVVLHVLYFVFNEGYTASSGPGLHRGDLTAEAIRLTRLLHRLMPAETEVAGLLALMLLTDARRAARTDAPGRTVMRDLPSLEDRDLHHLRPDRPLSDLQDHRATVVCRACKQRWARCTGCGLDRLIRGGTLETPLCATCTRPDSDFWHACPGCGEPGRIHTGGNARCARCTIRRRLRQVLGDDTGTIRPELRALHDALATTNRPATVEAWLNRSAAPKLLQALAGQPLTHDTLDGLPPSKPVEHLRRVLVAIGTLPARDEQLARLQRWTTDTIAAPANPDEQHLLRRYAIWHVLRRLRGRLNGADATHHQFIAAKRNIQAAVTLLDRLAGHGRTLATARQNDLDAWLAQDNAAHEAGNFVRWANRNKLTTLELPATRWAGTTATIDTEARWERARRLLHDNTLDPEDRVAGLLVLLYAQQPATISRLTHEHLQINDDNTRLRLGREPVVLPNRSPTSSATLPAPAADTPPSVPRTPPHGYSPAANPADRSAPSNSPNGSDTSASTPHNPAPPHCSNSPPHCPPRSSPACSASTSASPSPGNAPAPATGPNTPPKSAAGSANPVVQPTCAEDLNDSPSRSVRLGSEHQPNLLHGCTGTPRHNPELPDR
jgi:hypothetical protein